MNVYLQLEHSVSQTGLFGPPDRDVFAPRQNQGAPGKKLGQSANRNFPVAVEDRAQKHCPRETAAIFCHYQS